MPIFLAGLGVTHSIRERGECQRLKYTLYLLLLLPSSTNWFLAMRSAISAFTIHIQLAHSNVDIHQQLSFTFSRRTHFSWIKEVLICNLHSVFFWNVITSTINCDHI